MNSFIVHLTRPPPPWVSLGSRGQEEPPEFDFLGLGRDPAVSKQPEAKNHSKLTDFHNVWLFLGGFWLLVASNLHGRTPNP